MALSPSTEIFLHPGQYFFGDEKHVVKTLLGSCVSITMWHPQRKLGGMCHLVTPERIAAGPIEKLDGRYGHEAVLWLFQETSRRTTNPYDYEVHMFGGGRMFRRSVPGDTLDVGSRNIFYLSKLMGELGFKFKAKDVGQFGSRFMRFDINTGKISLQHNEDALEKSLDRVKLS